jgi:hypothetical protein
MPSPSTKKGQELRSRFITNAIPQEGDFADLIAAGLNQADDGLLKLPDQSLGLVRQSPDAPLLRLFADPEADGAAWQLQLGEGDRPSFSLLGADGRAALIVDGSTGPVGEYLEAATTPARPKLEVKGSLRCDAISGPVNLINKAHCSLKGGGTISWSKTNRLRWSQRFRAIRLGATSFSGEGYFDISSPASSESGNLESWDGVNRIDDAGIELHGWESLYAILTGAGPNNARLRIEDSSRKGEVPSNWLLIASRNGDDQTLKLGTGLTISPGQSVCHGSPYPCGSIIMWHGKTEDIPVGWVVCDGINGTPDLRGRFVLGSGQGTDLSMRDPQHPIGGNESVRLEVKHLPKHTHEINDPGHTSYCIPRNLGKTDYDLNIHRQLNGTSEWLGGFLRDYDFPNQIRETNITLQEEGSGEPFTIMPPFYILVFLMKSFA